MSGAGDLTVPPWRGMVAGLVAQSAVLGAVAIIMPVGLHAFALLFAFGSGAGAFAALAFWRIGVHFEGLFALLNELDGDA